MYYERKQMGYKEEDIMNSISTKARDNARTPMQWNDGYEAGFTEGTPWYRVNPNYMEINAKKALEDKDSIFYYYKELIYLRKKEPILIYGNFKLLYPEDKSVFAYIREWDYKKWLIVCNFYGNPTDFMYPAKGQVILSNYKQEPVILLENISLRPYEAIICELIET